MRNKIFITNEHEDISIEMTLHSDSATSPEQLIVRSIKALLRTIDIKDYARYGKHMHERFDSDLNEVAETVYEVAAMGGWAQRP